MTDLDAIHRLRQDALSRGLKDLAIVYGWSEIRLKMEDVLIRVAPTASKEMRKGLLR